MATGFTSREPLQPIIESVMKWVIAEVSQLLRIWCVSRRAASGSAWEFVPHYVSCLAESCSAEISFLASGTEWTAHAGHMCWKAETRLGQTGKIANKGGQI